MAPKPTATPPPKTTVSAEAEVTVNDEPRRDVPPFIVNGRNPASDNHLSAEERLAWLDKQHKAMRGR